MKGKKTAGRLLLLVTGLSVSRQLWEMAWNMPESGTDGKVRNQLFIHQLLGTLHESCCWAHLIQDLSALLCSALGTGLVYSCEQRLPVGADAEVLAWAKW